MQALLFTPLCIVILEVWQIPFSVYLINCLQFDPLKWITAANALHHPSFFTSALPAPLSIPWGIKMYAPPPGGQQAGPHQDQNLPAPCTSRSPFSYAAHCMSPNATGLEVIKPWWPVSSQLLFIISRSPMECIDTRNQFYHRSDHGYYCAIHSFIYLPCHGE